MSFYSTKVLNGINNQFEGEKDSFSTIDEVCVNIYLTDAVFKMCFITDEDEDLLTFVATDSEGREKIKVVNKEYIQSVEVYYLDDDMALEAEDKIDEMYN